MKYNIITKSAILFYCLATELEENSIKDLIPSKSDCDNSKIYIKGMLKEIALASYFVKNDILYNLDNGKYHFEKAVNMLCDKYTTGLSYVIKHFFRLLQSIHLLKYSDNIENFIKNLIQICNNKKFDYIKNIITPENISSLSERWINSLNKIETHVKNIEEVIPKLAEGEFDIIDDWKIVQHEVIIILNILDNLISNLDINGDILITLISVINERIDKIISIYSPSDEEQAKALLPPEEQDDPKAIKRILDGDYF